MADFAGTVGNTGSHIIVFEYTEGTRVIGAKETEITLIGGSGPKENTETGLLDLECKHVHLSPSFTAWCRAAAPFKPGGSGGATYDLERGDTLGGTTATSPTKFALYIGPFDPASGKFYSAAFLFKLERGSKDFQSGKGKYNELTSKFTGVQPTGSVAVSAELYAGTKVAGVASTIELDGADPTKNGYLEQWLLPA